MYERPCIIRSFPPAQGLLECQRCSPGFFAAFSGSSACAACVGGRYAGGSAYMCVACDTGSFAGAASAHCTSCAPVRAYLGRLSAISIFLCKSVLYGAFVWAHRVLNHQKRRFPARAGAVLGHPGARGCLRLPRVRAGPLQPAQQLDDVPDVRRRLVRRRRRRRGERRPSRAQPVARGGEALTAPSAGQLCLSCSPGRFSDGSLAQATGCVDCAPGRSDHDVNPRTPCERCAPGTFASGEGATDCERCAAGSASAALGAVRAGLGRVVASQRRSYHSTPYSRRDPVPLFPRRQCGRT